MKCKKWIATVLMLCMVLSLLPTTAVFAAETEIASGTCGDNLTWVLTTDGVLTISGTGEITTHPWDTYCEDILNVVIAEGVTGIGEWAFAWCEFLTSVTIPNSITTIGDCAFLYTGLTSVTIPDSVTSIGESAFEYCYSLANLYIGDGITRIGNYAFFECYNLIDVTIGSNVTNIGKEAFADCSSLTSITIPDSVTSIGEGAFAYCSGLDSVFFAGNVPTIGDGTFTCVTATVYYPAGNDTWNEEVMQNYGGTIAWVSYKTESNDPGIPSILAGGACGDNLTWVLTEDGTLTISGAGDMHDFRDVIAPWYAYESDIITVIIEDSVTSIGKDAFCDCSSLTSITIGDNVTSIGEGAFYFCTNLTSLTIPDSVTSIGDWVFHACISLTEIFFVGSAPTIGANTFTYVTATAYYPAGDKTWTEDVMQNYGGTITWVSYEPHGGNGEEEPDCIIGDTNDDGTINYLDAMLIAQYYVGDIEDGDLSLATADVNGDGAVNYLDAMLIAQFYVGDIDTLG